MLELIQFPASPFCIVQRRILEYSGAKFKITNIPNGDRSLIWKLTRERYYQVPVLKDGKNVVFETDDHSQVIAKYLNERLGLDLFPQEWAGIQDVIWRFFEDSIEGLTFKLNDIHWKEWVSKRDQLPFLRHKERKFGRGCLDKWREQEPALLQQLEHELLTCEQMLAHRDFLCLINRPLFVDFNLFGMLGNFLFSGHYTLPPAHTRLADWYQRMAKIKLNRSAREKLHT